MARTLRLRPLRHRRRLRRRAGGAAGGDVRGQGRHRRGVPGRRHLRDPRLRAEEVHGLRQRVLQRASSPPGATAGSLGEADVRLAGASCAPRTSRSPGSRASTSPTCRTPAPTSPTPAPSCRTRTRITLADRDRTLSAEKVLVATGGRPTLPEAPGIEHVITSEEAFQLPQLPKRMLIVGRRLHRRRVRRHLQRPRRRDHADLPRRQHPARLRQRRARAPDHGDGAARHHDHDSAASTPRSRRPRAG